MIYSKYRLLDEPFSNSPDPDFFYEIPGRVDCLNMLEVAIRLRRGLSVVMGDVGTGKTTLCRQLIRNLGDDHLFITHLIHDPSFASNVEFLQVLYKMLIAQEPDEQWTEWQLKEKIKDHLFESAHAKGKVIVLIIDEGQKLNDNVLELLRELLNFETNNNKLLQIVIFAQNEFQEAIDKYHNLADRINEFRRLAPLTFPEMQKMIQFRLDQVKDGTKTPKLFTRSALWAIYKNTKGFPRKIISLCHKTMLQMLANDARKVDLRIVNHCTGKKSIYIPSYISAPALVVIILVLCNFVFPYLITDASKSIVGFVKNPGLYTAHLYDRTLLMFDTDQDAHENSLNSAATISVQNESELTDISKLFLGSQDQDDSSCITQSTGSSHTNGNGDHVEINIALACFKKEQRHAHSENVFISFGAFESAQEAYSLSRVSEFSSLQPVITSKFKTGKIVQHEVVYPDHFSTEQNALLFLRQLPRKALQRARIKKGFDADTFIPGTGDKKKEFAATAYQTASR